MEQDVDTGYRTMCSTCLSTDRDLFLLNNIPQVDQIFKLLMYDFAGDRFGDSLQELENVVCWECLALMKRFMKFKWQVQSAQEHLRVLALSRAQETLHHTYMSQSLSSLEMTSKVEYDKIYFDYSSDAEQQYMCISTSECVKHEQYDVAHARDDNILEVPEIVLENPVTGDMSHIVVGADSLVSGPFTHTVKGEIPHLTIEPLQTPKLETVIICQKDKDDESKSSYITEYMSEADMLASREEAKNKVQYAGSAYKCELCIVGFYSQQQVEDHFVSAHRAKPGQVVCKVCYCYVSAHTLPTHTDSHYLRYSCKLCGHTELSCRLIQHHIRRHKTKSSNTVINIQATPAIVNE